jgi:hypothetical protein
MGKTRAKPIQFERKANEKQAQVSNATQTCNANAKKKSKSSLRRMWSTCKTDTKTNEKRQQCQRKASAKPMQNQHKANNAKQKQRERKAYAKRTQSEQSIADAKRMRSVRMSTFTRYNSDHLKINRQQTLASKIALHWGL